MLIGRFKPGECLDSVSTPRLPASRAETVNVCAHFALTPAKGKRDGAHVGCELPRLPEDIETGFKR